MLSIHWFVRFCCCASLSTYHTMLNNTLPLQFLQSKENETTSTTKSRWQVSPLQRRKNCHDQHNTPQEKDKSSIPIIEFHPFTRRRLETMSRAWHFIISHSGRIHKNLSERSQPITIQIHHLFISWLFLIHRFQGSTLNSSKSDPIDSKHVIDSISPKNDIFFLSTKFFLHSIDDISHTHIITYIYTYIYINLLRNDCIGFSWRGLTLQRIEVNQLTIQKKETKRERERERERERNKKERVGMKNKKKNDNPFSYSSSSFFFFFCFFFVLLFLYISYLLNLSTPVRVRPHTHTHAHTHTHTNTHTNIDI